MVYHLSGKYMKTLTDLLLAELQAQRKAAHGLQTLNITAGNYYLEALDKLHDRFREIISEFEYKTET